jgi:hypothetical protein
MKRARSPEHVHVPRATREATEYAKSAADADPIADFPYFGDYREASIGESTLQHGIRVARPKRSPYARVPCKRAQSRGSHVFPHRDFGHSPRGPGCSCARRKRCFLHRGWPNQRRWGSWSDRIDHDRFASPVWTTLIVLGSVLSVLLIFAAFQFSTSPWLDRSPWSSKAKGGKITRERDHRKDES